MACVRCEIHPVNGRPPYKYLEKDAKQPDGSPNPLICGRKNCDKPGLVWLNQYEADAYDNENERIFSARTSKKSGFGCGPIAKIRVR